MEYFKLLHFCCLVIGCLFPAPYFAKQLSLHTSHIDHLTTYEKLYDLGMDAYRREKWAKCSKFFERAIDDFHYYKTAVTDCRLMCKGDDLDENADKELSVLHSFIVQSNCLRRCKKRRLNNRPQEPVSQSTGQKFENRLPYNYLQFCYFKEERYKEAAAAAYTYYVTHGDDSATLESLQYYRDVADLNDDDMVDLERTEFQKAYIIGLQAYNVEDWEGVVDKFTDSLSHYYMDEERCRAECEHPYTHNSFPDFVNAVADHYIVVIVCQQRCITRLSTFGIDGLDDFVAQHYNYLQFAYFNSRKFDAAIRAVASYLLFKPSDVEMLNNKEYYINTLGYSKEDFIPFEDAVRYVNYWRQVERSLDFVRETYALPLDDITDDDQSQIDKLFTLPENVAAIVISDDHYMKKFTDAGVKLVAESRQLNGPLRFAVDDFYKEHQCQALAELAMSADRDKTGVRQVSVHDVIQLVKRDSSHEISLRILLRSSEFVQAYTQAYFNQSLLWTQDVKVICRSGGSKWEKAIGEDCLPQETGGCHGDSSNPDYLALVYLSDIYDGTGHLYFLDKRQNVQSSLVPKCGRLVGFAGTNNHGVNLSWKLDRCALVIALSRSKANHRPVLTEAANFLKELEEAQTKEMESGSNADILNDFYNQGVTVLKSGEELHGKERFVADGLANTGECLELMDLARKGVLPGDGYDTDQSITRTTAPSTPHTVNEMFSGLNISRAVKLVESGAVPAHSLELLLDVSAMALLLVETYFNMTRPLYFEFTHLVCRTAIPVEKEDGGVDLSHPVHSDNCDLQENGTCTVNYLTHRHYSALLYLNEDFEGGEFFFAHENKSEQISLRPKCGRLVSFNSRDYHGVKGVQSGQRCAVAMWYTHDPDREEVPQIQARKQLAKIKIKSMKKKHHKKSNKKAHKNEDSNISEILVSENLDKTLDLNQYSHLGKTTESEEVDFLAVKESNQGSSDSDTSDTLENGEVSNELDVEQVDDKGNVPRSDVPDSLPGDVDDNGNVPRSDVPDSLPGDMDDENHDEL